MGEDMAPQPVKLAFIFAMALAVAAFITITAVAKHEDGWRALSAPGTIHRSGLVNVY
jgi:hypothetical protein